MLVISLTGFIVEPHDADIVYDQGKAIFEVVDAAAKRLRHLPHHQFCRRIFRKRNDDIAYCYRIHHTPSPTVM